MKLKRDKKGGIGIIIFFSILLIVLIIGFVATIVWAVVDIASDEITPIMEGLGMVGDVNMSEASRLSFGVADTVVQSMPYLIAFAYIMSLIFTLVFVFLVGYTPHPVFIVLYFALMLLLVFGSIVMSNVYQDIYSGTDDLALRLQEQTIMSYLILHSPVILVFIAIVGGIFMFTRAASQEGNFGGGYGI